RKCVHGRLVHARFIIGSGATLARCNYWLNGRRRKALRRKLNAWARRELSPDPRRPNRRNRCRNRPPCRDQSLKPYPPRLQSTPNQLRQVQLRPIRHWAAVAQAILPAKCRFTKDRG